MENKEEEIKRLEAEVKKGLESFHDLKNIVDADSKQLDLRIKEQVELLLKEINNNSLISVTAAPFSLFILQTKLTINLDLLIFSFVIFMINALVLNIGYWYYNNRLLRSISSQKLENITMSMAEMNINNSSLDNFKRVNALTDFFNSSSQLKVKKETEYYEYIKVINTIRFIGIALLVSAISFLILAIILPIICR